MHYACGSRKRPDMGSDFSMWPPDVRERRQRATRARLPQRRLGGRPNGGHADHSHSTLFEPLGLLCVLSLERRANICRAAPLSCMARRWLPQRCTSCRTTTRRGLDVQSASTRPCSSASPGGCAQAPAGCTCWQPKLLQECLPGAPWLCGLLACPTALQRHLAGFAQVPAGCTWLQVSAPANRVGLECYGRAVCVHTPLLWRACPRVLKLMSCRGYVMNHCQNWLLVRFLHALCSSA